MIIRSLFLKAEIKKNGHTLGLSIVCSPSYMFVAKGFFLIKKIDPAKKVVAFLSSVFAVLQIHLSLLKDNRLPEWMGPWAPDGSAGHVCGHAQRGACFRCTVLKSSARNRTKAKCRLKFCCCQSDIQISFHCGGQQSALFYWVEKEFSFTCVEGRGGAKQMRTYKNCQLLLSLKTTFILTQNVLATRVSKTFSRGLLTLWKLS